mmetsp:Transcript_12407/g.34186  ORF Transcript_12407/g.34186 Transcript_12407/m.34186 type:complete len:289 (-) Transcript_12407:119-985(-)|eukprot:CAMPEP_0198116930 /NCGR_PEP_ID=MMETSP1442-20131203/15559_1 /TAXON_ID= /ORGANISM="Craspedostauros australis, Strain CCMP3328" /LENGTH=288 /DNA_ID=CAMNT_0043774867 /DNA_START=189 /DNA_END=1055 /DNA_ORIENTATION=+
MFPRSTGPNLILVAALLLSICALSTANDHDDGSGNSNAAFHQKSANLRDGSAAILHLHPYVEDDNATDVPTMSPTNHTNATAGTDSPTMAPTTNSTSPNVTTVSPTQAPTSNTTQLSSVPTMAPTANSTDDHGNSTNTSMPTMAPTVAPTVANSSVPSPAPTTAPVDAITDSPTMAPMAAPSLSPTIDNGSHHHHHHKISFWTIVGKTIAWLIIIMLSVLGFGACMSNRYRIYYYLRAAYYSFLRLRYVQWVIRKLHLQRFVGTGSSESLNEIIFDDMQEGLLLQEDI